MGPEGNGGCRLGGEPIKYSKLVSQHAGGCHGEHLLCPLGCEREIYSEAEADWHLNHECPKGLIQCKCCEHCMLRTETEQHSCMEIMYDEILTLEQ